MTKQVDVTSETQAVTAADRIEEGAERVKAATSDAVEHSKEAFDRAADKVESKLHSATDKVADGATRASEKVADVTERGQAVYDEAMDKANDWLDQAREYVREKPVQSVAIAVAAGWLASRILRR
jgi:ElaB/YqjD/DUF883 family membrane-anchored ribosome-binding protein